MEESAYLVPYLEAFSSLYLETVNASDRPRTYGLKVSHKHFNLFLNNCFKKTTKNMMVISHSKGNYQFGFPTKALHINSLLSLLP